jgi:hypothetical protein
MPDHTTIADERGTVRKLALQGLRRAGADDPLFAPAAAAEEERASGLTGDLILVDVNLDDGNLAGARADGAPRDGSGAPGREAQ